MLILNLQWFHVTYQWSKHAGNLSSRPSKTYGSFQAHFRSHKQSGPVLSFSQTFLFNSKRSKRYEKRNTSGFLSFPSTHELCAFVVLEGVLAGVLGVCWLHQPITGQNELISITTWIKCTNARALCSAIMRSCVTSRTENRLSSVYLFTHCHENCIAISITDIIAKKT